MVDFSALSQWPINPSMVLRPELFDPESENFLGHFPTFKSELTQLISEFTQGQQEIITSEQNAAQSAQDAATEVQNCKNEVVLAEVHAETARQHKETTRAYAENILLDPALSTSATSLEISIGAKSLITDTDRNYVPAMWIVLIDKTDPKIWMKGYVATYDTGTGALSIMITDKSGTGTYSDWLITQTNPIVQSQPRPTIAATLLFS